MFVHLLSPIQKKAFLTLAKRFLVVDKKLRREETDELYDICLAMGCSMDDADTDIEDADLLALFDSSRNQAIAVLEMLRLAYADGEFTMSENNRIFAMTRAFSMDDDILAAMEKWVLKRLALDKEAQVFLKG